MISSRYSWHKRKVSCRCVLPQRLQQTAPRAADQPMTRIQRCFQAGGVFRFYGDHLICGISCLISTATPAARPPRRLAQIRGRDGRPAGAVPAPRALPGNHHRMIERRHPGEPLCCDSSIALAFASSKFAPWSTLRRRSRAPRRL